MNTQPYKDGGQHQDRNEHNGAYESRPKEHAKTSTQNKTNHNPQGNKSARSKSSAKFKYSDKSRSSRPAKHRAPLFAAIDLGTNNCRLLVAAPRRHGFNIVQSYSKIVRLGEGLSHSKHLSEVAMERAIKALKVCREKVDRLKVKHVRMIATEACRKATNSPQFLERIHRETGFDAEIISQREEAELAATGCAALIDPDADGTFLFDIGGGSCEIAWLDFTGGRPKSLAKIPTAIRTWKSIPCGVITLSEKFGGQNVTEDIFEAMIDFVRRRLRHFRGRNKLKSFISNNNIHFLGTSGTVTTVAGVYLGLERYNRSQVDGFWMDNEAIDTSLAQMLNMSYDERVANGCIGEDRADLVLAGCAIFEALRREWPCNRLCIADRGIREGLLIGMMAADKSRRRFRQGHPSRLNSRTTRS